MVTPDRARYAYVYCRSAEQKAEWEGKAKEANVPLSKLLVEIIEKSLDNEDDSLSRVKLIKEVAELKNSNGELQRDLNTKNIVIDRYEEELRRYRNAAFLDADFKGMRKHSQDLIQLLKREKVLDSYTIADKLNVDLRDSEAVKTLSNELDALEGYGLIARHLKGWKWVG
jgi:Cdc6-like AAA superfamily ATPase